jgi:hypothetical protein
MTYPHPGDAYACGSKIVNYAAGFVKIDHSKSCVKWQAEQAKCK